MRLKKVNILRLDCMDHDKEKRNNNSKGHILIPCHNFYGSSSKQG
jgi:hypothetical protein